MCLFCENPSGGPLCPRCADRENAAVLCRALLEGESFDGPERLRAYARKLGGPRARAEEALRLCGAHPELGLENFGAEALGLMGASMRAHFIPAAEACLDGCSESGDYCRLACALASALDAAYAYDRALALCGTLTEHFAYAPAELVRADCLVKLRRPDEALAALERGLRDTQTRLETGEFPSEGSWQAARELEARFRRTLDDVRGQTRRGELYIPRDAAGRQKLARLLAAEGKKLNARPERPVLRSGCADFVAFDLETTGFGPEARVTEIGAVRVSGGAVVDRFDTLVDPGVPIPPAITALTGISDETVFGAPLICDALPDFLAFAGSGPLAAHNAPFDMRFILREADALGLAVPNPVIDTLRLARRIWPGLPSYKLTELTARFGISQREAHRAWCDAEAAAELYLRMQK